MRVSSTIVGLVGAVAGVATAVTGYHHLAALDADRPSSTTALPAVGRPLPAPRPGSGSGWPAADPPPGSCTVPV